MSDEPQGGTNGGDTPPADEFRPITSQEEFDKALSKRLERERAKFADYDDLKQRAGRLAEIEEASKTEAQKAVERAERAERLAAEYQQAAVKSQIAGELGVPPSLLTGTNEDELRASAQAVLAWHEERAKSVAAPKPKPSALASGSAPARGAEQGRAAAALRALRQG